MTTALASAPRVFRPRGDRSDLDKKQFGERLKELREQAHLNQWQLADRIGVSQSRISEWEAGKRVPLITTAIEIAQALGVSCDTLLPLHMANPRDADGKLIPPEPEPPQRGRPKKQREE